MKEKGGRVLKIIDFGTAQDLSVNPKPKVMVGTPEFIGKKGSTLIGRTANIIPGIFAFPFSS